MKIKHNASHPLAKRVEAIMEGYDSGRLSLAGGYPPDWMILGDLVIIATLGGGDWNEPELVVEPIDEFVKEQEERIAELEE
jgi:hypothetical protein